MKILRFKDFLFEAQSKKSHKSHVVIVAPHAVDSDDKNTKEIAELMSKELGAYLLINSKFHKKCGKKDCKKDEDFNHLPPFVDGKYDWSQRVPEMKEFYEDLFSFAKQASKENQSNNKRCLVLFLHGLKSKNFDVDLGAGMSSAPNMTINAEQHPESGKNDGDVTAPVHFVEEFKHKLSDKGLDVGTGEVFSAWDSQNGVQYLKKMGVDCYCIQVEMDSSKRRNPKKIAETLSDVVRDMTDFSESVYKNPQEYGLNESKSSKGPTKEVIEAAKAKGYTIGPVYHGTNEVFTEFNPEKVAWIFRNQPMKYHFAYKKEFAKSGGKPTDKNVKHVMPVFIKGTIDGTYDDDDNLIPKNADYVDMPGFMITVRNPEQIKLADPVTYDDDGNPIPLEKRFDSKNKDIRY